PVDGPRRRCAAALPNMPVLGGVAEAIPLRDGAVDGVVVGTAFHWFDGPVALGEIHRVLRPGGRLGLAWTARDESVDWVARLVRLVDGYKRGDPPRYTGGAWRQAFATSTLFTPLEERCFLYVQEGDRQTVLARVASTSFVGTLSPEERRRVLQEVTTLLDTHPDTAGRTAIPLPYRTDVFWCVRR
ncbi:MAG: class I SAM-dependent methyltransferase, partial [Chloroflexota bacterium]